MARPRRIPQKKKEPELVIAEGFLVKDLPSSCIQNDGLKEGTRVKIARIINTPIGLRFRIFETIKWVPEDTIECEFDHSMVVDYVKIAEENCLKQKNQKLDRKNLIGCKAQKAPVINKSVSRVRRLNNKLGRTRLVMDKTELKQAISTLTTGDSLSLTFLSTMPTGDEATNKRYDGIRHLAGKTIQATLVDTKKGRGKGGSQLIVLKTEDGETFTTGTPHSEAILNITTAAGMVGHESEADIPKTFETDSGRAASLKEDMRALVGTIGAQVRITSSEAEFSGDFTVTKAELLKGRYGQVRAYLQNDAGRMAQLWSYRHSGVVSGFEVLSAGTAEETTPVETSGEETAVSAL